MALITVKATKGKYVEKPIPRIQGVIPNGFRLLGDNEPKQEGDYCSERIELFGVVDDAWGLVDMDVESKNLKALIYIRPV